MRQLITAALLFFVLQTGNGSVAYEVPMEAEEPSEEKVSYPRLQYADSVINSRPIETKRVAWRQKNPGNIRCYRTLKYLQFSHLEKGYAALIRQLDLYVTGRSRWTDSTTTLEQHVKNYASEASPKGMERYIKVMEKGLKKTRDSLIRHMDVDSLAKYHIKAEDIKLFQIMYN